MSSDSVLKIGLIGDHIGQSRFAAAMDILCSMHGMTLEFTPIDTGEIDDFDFNRKIDELIEAGWTGVTVTHPYKVAARARWGRDARRGVTSDVL